MTKRIALFLLFATMMALFTANAVAQNTVVKGVCKDENGKPIIGGTVELNNLEEWGQNQRQDRQPRRVLHLRRYCRKL